MHYWADLQSLHGFSCNDTITPRGLAIGAHDNAAASAKCQRVFALALCVVCVCVCVARNITFAEMEALIDELAKKYKDDHKVDEDTAKQQISQKLTKTKSKTHGTTVHLA